MTNTRKKLTSPGYQMKLIENFHSYNNNNFTQNIKKKKSPKKKVNHKESEDLLKINAEMKKIEKSSDLYKCNKYLLFIIILINSK